MSDVWLKETSELIRDLEVRADGVRLRLDDVKVEIEVLEARIASGKALVLAYRAKHGE